MFFFFRCISTTVKLLVLVLMGLVSFDPHFRQIAMKAVTKKYQSISHSKEFEKIVSNVLGGDVKRSVNYLNSKPQKHDEIETPDDF